MQTEIGSYTAACRGRPAVSLVNDSDPRSLLPLRISKNPWIFDNYPSLEISNARPAADLRVECENKLSLHLSRIAFKVKRDPLIVESWSAPVEKRQPAVACLTAMITCTSSKSFPVVGRGGTILPKNPTCPKKMKSTLF